MTWSTLLVFKAIRGVLFLSLYNFPEKQGIFCDLEIKGKMDLRFNLIPIFLMGYKNSLK